MQPLDLLILAAAGAVLAVGFTRMRKRRGRAFAPAVLDEVKRALAAQGFEIASYDHALAGKDALLTTGLGVRHGDRVVGTLAPTRAGVSASIVVHGMKPPSAAFRVGRDRGKLKKEADVDTGDAAFDARLKVSGAPHDAVRALVQKNGVRDAIASVFAIDDVAELRLLALGDQGAVRVELELPRERLDLTRAKNAARALADAIDAP